MTSCSNDLHDINSSKEPTRKIVVRKSTSHPTVGSLGIRSQKDSYDILFNDISLKNIPLSLKEVEILRKGSSIGTPIPVTVKGYSEWTIRKTGNKGGNWYTLALGDNDAGIPPGLYVVRDVWFWQTYEIPSPLAIVFPNNNYPDASMMGWHPDSGKGVGLTTSLSNTTVTLKTAGSIVKYTLNGSEVIHTLPFNKSKLEWHFYYIPIEL